MAAAGAAVEPAAAGAGAAAAGMAGLGLAAAAAAGTAVVGPAAAAEAAGGVKEAARFGRAGPLSVLTGGWPATTLSQKGTVPKVRSL